MMSDSIGGCQYVLGPWSQNWGVIALGHMQTQQQVGSTLS